MKKHILGLLFLSVAGTCLTSCGDDFFDTKNYTGVDVDNGLTDASSVRNAVNGERNHDDKQVAGNTCRGDSDDCEC